MWRRVKGWPGYAISTKGTVLSYRTTNGKDSKTPRLLAVRITNKNYPLVVLWNKGHSWQICVHRLVMLTFKPCKNHASLYVLHKDNDTRNCALSNLKWGTHKDNMRDRDLCGRTCRGKYVKGGRRKLQEKSVVQIRKLLRIGSLSRTAIAAQFGVARQTINDIAWGYAWKWAQE